METNTNMNQRNIMYEYQIGKQFLHGLKNLSIECRFCVWEGFSYIQGQLCAITRTCHF
jgi:hypothetical protein